MTEVFGALPISPKKKEERKKKEMEENEKIAKILEKSPNIILYGPPGTGKTYELQNKYFEYFTSEKKTQTKKDFIKEKVEPLYWHEAIALALLDLKAAKVPELVKHEAILCKAGVSFSKDVNATCWTQLLKRTHSECENVAYKTRYEPAIFWKEQDSTWRLHSENLLKENLPEIYSLWSEINDYKEKEEKIIVEKRYEFVTFHQSFSYEDFIEGIKPELSSETESNELSYKIEPGVFYRLAKKAKDNQGEKWALFIDEINRGNISNIFGELITLIEDDKRAGGNNALSATLPYSKENFSVPKNLYIIGTMNTADRSIEALDTALRRRFSFIEVAPNIELLKGKNIDGIDIRQLLKTMNERILRLMGKDNLIGHSYFLNVENLEDLQVAFKNKIIPLLEEYFYNDRAKIGMVLGSGFVSSPSEEKITFAAGFGGEDISNENPVYEIKDAMNAGESDFINIYKK